MSLPHSETAVTFDLAALNEEFAALDFQERITRLYRYFPVEQVLFTSSFGTKSVVMLTLVSRANADQKVHILNTGYHFPETLAYRNTLAASHRPGDGRDPTRSRTPRPEPGASHVGQPARSLLPL